MQTRQIGPLRVSAIGLGCMGMTPIYGEPDQDECIATLHRAIELGVNFIDTADVYGAGAQRGAGRPRARKAGATRSCWRPSSATCASPTAAARSTAAPNTSLQACDASLKRLGVDVIDLYYQHRVDPDVPIEETVGAMARLVEAGKVRHLGLSEAGAGTIRRAHADASDRGAADRVLALVPGRGGRDPAGLPRARHRLRALRPLGRGFLSGTITSLDALAENDRRREHPALPRREPRSAMSACSARCGSSPRHAQARPPRSRSPGCWRKATTSCRSPAPSGAGISRRTPPRSRSG